MQRKQSHLNDIKVKFLSQTGIVFYDTTSKFRDTLIRKTLFFGNIPVSMCPKFTGSCIVLSGILLENLFYSHQEGSSLINHSSREHIFIISTKKLFNCKSKYSIYIYKLETFAKIENISEMYIRFFKLQPYLLQDSIKEMFKLHKKRIFKNNYLQSEFLVNYINFIYSRLSINLNCKVSLSIHFVRFWYKLFIFLKTFSSDKLFSYIKNNSFYFLIYNWESYQEIFDSEFIVIKDF